MNTTLLKQHFATDGFWGFGALPNPDLILRKLGRSVSAYRELLSDPIVSGAVRRRKSAVCRLSWRIESDTHEDILTQALHHLGVPQLIDAMMEAVLYGYQPMEVIWQLDGIWLPKAVVAKPQEWFGFDGQGQMLYLNQGATPVPEYKFICPKHGDTYTNPYGVPELASVYWATVFKRGGLKFWAEFAEKFGSPWIIGREPRSNTEEDTIRLLDALESLMGNAVATIPDDSSVEIKEATGKTGSSQVFDDFIRYCRSEINIALLGQDQSTEKDSTHASATAGLEVTSDIRDGDCRMVETAMNELLALICALNFEQASAKFVLYEVQEGDRLLAERDQILGNLGVSFSEAYFSRAYHLSEADFRLAAPIAKSAEFAELGGLPADLSDRLAQGMPSEDELQAQMAAMLSDFGTLDGIDGTDALLEKLAALYPSMNIDALEDKLTQMLFVAKTLSRLEVMDEVSDG